MNPEERAAHRQFVRALQHEPLVCGRAPCPSPVETADLSQLRDRVKVFEAHCRCCGWQARITGREQPTPSWDKARYRLSCFYCGRQAEMGWPPPEARR